MMEEPRQQPAPVAPPPSQSAYQQAAYAPAPAPPPPYPAAPPAQPSSRDIAFRVARLLARRLLWLVEQVWRAIEPRLGWVLLTGFLLAVIGVLSLMLVLPRLLAGQAQPADPRVASLAPAPAVEDFLRGQQTYDADLMWESFSPSLRESHEITREALIEHVEFARRAGLRYRDPQYIGGIEVGGRQRMYFYAVEVVSPQERGVLSFVFTVGSDGKIVNVQ